MKKIELFTIFWAIVSFFSISSAQISVEKLECEYLVNPIGVDVVNPRLSWKIISARPDAIQKACQIIIGTDSVEVAGGKGNVWESGEIFAKSIPIVYRGPSLQPFTKYFWKVKVMDENDNWSDFSKVAFFETGMMRQENWIGNWITDTYDYNLKPAPYFRKSFEIDKKARSARAYIAVAGLYEMYLNGNRVGNHFLDPMYTRFDRKTFYVAYDITYSLQKGENVIGIILGNGWYNHQAKAVWYFDKAPWRARPKFCMDIRITFEDGSDTVICTGQDWKTSPSPIIYNSIYTGEHYDARLEQPGWNMTGFDDSSWKNALCTGSPSQNIVPQLLHPIRTIEKIDATEMIQLDAKTFLYNFGRNISGVCKITTSGSAGTIIRLKHAERLDENRHADQSNIDVHYRPTDESEPFMTDIFILCGNGEETFMPRFNYKGFQYVEVSADRPIKLTKESLSAYFVHSDVPVAGSIRSSNPILNKIWQAANASYLSNLFGYPTDCPQREKNGWTGDAHINIETGLYNFDGITIYEKWLDDHKNEQQPNGVLPAIIPSGGYGYHWANGPDWTSSIAIIPWNIYLFYGDSRLLESCYNNIKQYVDCIDRRSPSGLTDWGLGDWVPVRTKTPKEFTSSVYFFVDATILAKTAKILGNQTDFEKYESLSSKIKNAINKKYLDVSKGIYGNGSQTEMSVALKWGIVPDSLIPKIAGKLAERVISDNYHVDVGLLGSKAILNALSENGYADLAYKMAVQETYPSWGWWIKNGATTLYENWDINARRDLSLNHIMFGEINAWFYKGLAGIFPDENQPGFKNVILKPNFVSGLKQFEARHDGPYGTIVSSWERSGKKVLYNVVIPANSTATLYLSGKKVMVKGNGRAEKKIIEAENAKSKLCFHLSAGNYVFTIDEL